MPLEWLIDLMKEWVTAQAYATEAWVLAKLYATESFVLEWITPYNVTGDLNPDITCTYFKAGTHNGKPYYKRADGLWYIFWYPFGLDEWWISTALDSIDVGWFRTDPNIEGAYTPHVVTGIATVASGYKMACHAFVDRGDVDTKDFTLPDFTTNLAWHDLDLSGIIPADAKGVCVRLNLKANVTNAYIFFRKKGNVNDINMSILRTQVVNLSIDNDTVISLDENRIVEYKASNVNWVVIDFVVKNWWF